MKKVVLSGLLIVGALTTSWAQLWQDNFDDEADGATSGVALGGTWSVTYGGGGSLAKQTDDVYGEVIRAANLDGEAVWATNVINVSAYGLARIDIGEVGSGFLNGGTDYLRCFYRVDGGAEVQFFELTGANITTAATAIISATSTIQLIIRIQNGSALNDFYFDDRFVFDDVTITPIVTLYSRKNGNWTDATVGDATWSDVALGGTSCDCAPNQNTRVIIGNGNTVNVNGTDNIAIIEVQNTGILRWTAAAAMNFIGGGGIVVNTGGTIDRNGQTASIEFEDNLDYYVTVEGPVTLTDLTINEGAVFSIDLENTFTLSGDINVNEASTINLSGAGVLSIGDDLNIADNTIINATISNSITITDDIVITGNSDLTFSKVSQVTLESIVISNADQVDISGNGILTISGDIDVNNTSSLTFGGGQTSVADDLLFDANNITLTNNLSTGPGLIISDRIQFSADNCQITNNGILSSGSVIGFNANADDNIISNSVGATFDVGTINPNSGDFDLLNSGTINQSGNFTNIDAADTNFDNLATGVWNWTLTPSTTFDTDMATVLNCSAVGNTFNYSGAGDQRIIPVQYGNLGLSGSGAKDANNANISVNGNWTQTGVTFTEGTGTVTFNGASAQVINNSTDNTFYNLTLNKSAAANTVTMNNALTVSNTLTLTTGGLLLNGNQLNITRNATGAMAAAANGYLVSESEASAVVWNTRAVTGTFTFPFRNAAGGTAIAVTFNKTSAGTESGTGAFAVSTYGTGATNTPYPSGVLHTKDATGVDISANVADRFWIITPSGYSTVPNATVTFRVTNAERPTGTPSLVAQRWNTVASLWDAVIAGQSSTTTSAQVAIPGTFSAWALSDSSTPLPIELLSFEAQQSGNEVKLNWATATELNNDFFTVERLNDADGFDVVLTHPGKGTTNEVSRYEVFDRSPRVGKNYYRLKQTDFDGQYSYSDIVMVEFASVGELLKVYPNPSNRKPLNLEVRALAPHQSVPVVISTALGTSAFRATVQADANGYLHVEVPTTDWPTGLYLIQVGTETGRQLKVIID